MPEDGRGALRVVDGSAQKVRAEQVRRHGVELPAEVSDDVGLGAANVVGRVLALAHEYQVGERGHAPLGELRSDKDAGDSDKLHLRLVELHGREETVEVGHGEADRVVANAEVIAQLRVRRAGGGGRGGAGAAVGCARSGGGGGEGIPRGNRVRGGVLGRGVFR